MKKIVILIMAMVMMMFSGCGRDIVKTHVQLSDLNGEVFYETILEENIIEETTWEEATVQSWD